jgi:hypothetical protein
MHGQHGDTPDSVGQHAHIDVRQAGHHPGRTDDDPHRHGQRLGFVYDIEAPDMGPRAERKQSGQNGDEKPWHHFIA